jgi:hypothetical protein
MTPNYAGKRFDINRLLVERDKWFAHVDSATRSPRGSHVLFD